MNTDVRTATTSDTVEAIRERVAADPPELEGLATVFVLDDVGPPRRELRAEPICSPADQHRGPCPRSPASLPVERVIDLFALQDYLALPVVDDDGRLVGVIAIDDVLEELLAERLPGQSRFARDPPPLCGRREDRVDARSPAPLAYEAEDGVSPCLRPSSVPDCLAGLSDDDPAGITTYSVLGADHGYRLLWVLLLSTFALVLFHDLGARMGVVTGQGLTGLVREAYGVRRAGVAVAALVVGQRRNDLRRVRWDRRRVSSCSA